MLVNLILFILFFSPFVFCTVVIVLFIKILNFKSTTGKSFFSPEGVGIYGESLTKDILDKLDMTKMVFRNLYIPITDKDRTTEIDLILVTMKGIFVFESKNYSGWIFGNADQRYWIQTFQNGRKQKFYNPILQNIGHINALKGYLALDSGTEIFSYIVFSQRCTLKNIKHDSELVRVVKRNYLKDDITLMLQKTPNCFDAYEYDRICDKLQRCCNASDEIKTTHIANINEHYKKH